MALARGGGGSFGGGGFHGGGGFAGGGFRGGGFTGASMALALALPLSTMVAASAVLVPAPSFGEVMITTSVTIAMDGLWVYPHGYHDDYAYYDCPYSYDDSYYDNGSCHVVNRRVHTTHGWRTRPVQVRG
ncbi:hypothetical protein [Bradyrhizobium genosp. P]|uniref:hypothetical protein n=1 Tax=Bradyrhizobium genosp. P TaxID=83641 RepID=UPI003CFAD012